MTKGKNCAHKTVARDGHLSVGIQEVHHLVAGLPSLCEGVLRIVRHHSRSDAEEEIDSSRSPCQPFPPSWISDGNSEQQGEGEQPAEIARNAIPESHATAASGKKIENRECSAGRDDQ